MGQYTDKLLRGGGDGDGALVVKKGDRLGCFSLGSSIVLIFEAPKNFHFVVEPGQKVLFGQPIGTVGKT